MHIPAIMRRARAEPSTTRTPVWCTAERPEWQEMPTPGSRWPVRAGSATTPTQGTAWRTTTATFTRTTTATSIRRVRAKGGSSTAAAAGVHLPRASIAPQPTTKRRRESRAATAGATSAPVDGAAATVAVDGLTVVVEDLVEADSAAVDSGGEGAWSLSQSSDPPYRPLRRTIRVGHPVLLSLGKSDYCSSGRTGPELCA